MAIINDNLEEFKEEIPVPIHKPDNYVGATVDSQYTPTSSLAAYLEGSAYTVNYYSGVRGANDPLSSFQRGISPVYQQYKLIKGFVLRLKGSLNHSHDNQTGTETITGTANVYHVLAPNKGDMFIADVGDGREGVFQVTNVAKMSVFLQAAHEIEFTLNYFNSSELNKELDSRIVDTLYFNYDYMASGNNPLIREHEVLTGISLSEHYTSLARSFMNDFFSPVVSTILVPDQDKPTYDPFMTDLVLSLFTTEMHHEVKYINRLSVSKDNSIKTNTIIDVVLNLEPELLRSVTREIALVPTRVFKTVPRLGSIYYTKVEQVMYPKEMLTRVDDQYFPRQDEIDAELTKGKAKFTSLARLSEFKPIETDVNYDRLNTKVIPLFHPVSKDGLYIFSKAFYTEEKEEGLSALEQLIQNMINGKGIDKKKLLYICEKIHSAANLERFYYIPFLLMLINVNPRGISG